MLINISPYIKLFTNPIPLSRYPEFFKVYVLKAQCVDRLMKEFTSVASLPKHIVQEFFKNSDDFLIHLRPDETMHSMFTIITKRKLNSLKELATQNIEKTQEEEEHQQQHQPPPIVHHPPLMTMCRHRWTTTRFLLINQTLISPALLGNAY